MVEREGNGEELKSKEKGREGLKSKNVASSSQ